MNVSVDQTRHDRASKPRYPSLLHGALAKRDGPQFTADLLQGSRTASIADPKISNGKPHDYWPISVRTAYSSGKKVKSSAFCRKRTPEDPPVPVLKPIVRCTTRRCRNRQNWKLSSTSTSDSQAS